MTRAGPPQWRRAEGDGGISCDDDLLLLSLLAPEGPSTGNVEVVRGGSPFVSASLRPAQAGVLVVDSPLPRLAASALRRTGSRVGLFAVAPTLEQARAVAPIPGRARGEGWHRTAAALSLRVHARLAAAGGRPVVIATDGSAPGAWLLDAAGAPGGAVSARMSWRGPSGGAVAAVETASGDPSAVAKIAFDARRRGELEREERALADVAPGAATDAVRVPRLLDRSGPGALLEEALPGTPASRLPPHESERIFATLAAWLQQWNSATQTRAPGLLERTLECAARAGAPEAYRRWLAKRVGALRDEEVRAVATHGDLTLSNVLVDRSGALGVLDWENGLGAGFPLSDLFYAAADADLHAGSAASRADAVARVSAGAGRIAEMTNEAVGRAGMVPAVVTVLFHATWLVHAAHEAERDPPGSEFRDVVAMLAQHPDAHPRVGDA